MLNIRDKRGVIVALYMFNIRDKRGVIVANTIAKILISSGDCFAEGQ